MRRVIHDFSTVRMAFLGVGCYRKAHDSYLLFLSPRMASCVALADEYLVDHVIIAPQLKKMVKSMHSFDTPARTMELK